MKKDKRKYVTEEGNINYIEEWLLETDGSNLKEIIALRLFQICWK